MYIKVAGEFVGCARAMLSSGSTKGTRSTFGPKKTAPAVIS